MKDSLIIKFALFFLSILLIFSPVSLQASDESTSSQEIEPIELADDPKQMTQKEINDLFGEDPYLGQTSYLQSPDGFSQREKSQ
tara:strand:+ start:364 stop:615 length:252 start_codon:yes stop_codon:yes gene_type:complete